MRIPTPMTVISATTLIRTARPSGAPSKRVVQIGIRGSIYEPGEHDWAVSQGIRIIYMEEFVRRGAASVMEEARAIAGTGPTYVTFDIDCIDPSMAPGTGTPELGG